MIHGESPIALVYTRVSTGAQEDGTSLATQERACRAFAKTHGYRVAAVFSDVHSGAELYERPRLSALRDAIRRHEADALIVYALDRLARDIGHQFVVIEECDRAGVVLHCVSEPLDRSPEGKAITAMRGAFAEIERAKISERTMRGKLAKLNAGIPVMRAPYGYRQANGKRTIAEYEAAVVREIFELAADGESLRGIMRTLNARGIPAPAGGNWGRTHVYRILTNPAYKGATVAMRWRARKHAQAIRRPATDHIILPAGVTPAIVDDQLWDRVAARVHQRDATRTRNESRPFLLRGFIWCRQCGARMYAEVNKGTRRYRCSSRDKAAACGAKSIRADDIEAAAWDEVSLILVTPDVFEAALSRGRRDGADAEERLASVRRELARCDGRIDALLRTFDDPTIAPNVQRQIAEITREKESLRRQADRLDQAVRRRTDGQRAALAIETWRKRLERSLPTAGFDERRAMLEALQLRVMASQEEFDIEVGVPDVQGALR